MTEDAVLHRVLSNGRVSPTRVAMIGCGAVARISHLPAMKQCKSCMVTVLVDQNLGRAKQLATQFGVPAAVADYREAMRHVDAAIVALPNHLHAGVTVELLKNGVHTLVEKPMALSVQECDQMLRAASDSEAVLAVGLEYRFFNSSRLVKSVLESGLLGRILSFDLRQGVVLRWPFTTDYIYRKELAGGGVLVDFGPHMLDLLLWWFGDVEGLEYFDNAEGGTESDAEVHLRFESGVLGTVEMSRTRALRNSCLIRGERASIDVGIWDSDAEMRLLLPGEELALTGRVRDEKAVGESFHDIYSRQIADFMAAIREKRDPFVSGRDGRRAVALIERCYSSRKRLHEPWWSLETSVAAVQS